MDRGETIKSWYKDCLENIQTVHSIFINTFGEDRVDLQGVLSEDDFVSQMLGKLITLPEKATMLIGDVSEDDFIVYQERLRNVLRQNLNNAIIIVHFPELTITNERGRTHLIRDMYARVVLSPNGKLHSGPQFHRATFTHAECKNNYLHSHVRTIRFDHLTEWQGGCLGSGPIRDTISRLSIDFSWEDWTLFAVQLDQYVHVESLVGGPYHRMESVGPNNGRWREQHDIVRFPRLSLPLLYSVSNVMVPRFSENFTKEHFSEFVTYFCKHFRETGLFIAFANDHYFWGSPVIETVEKMSNMFIEWFNTKRHLGEITATCEELLQNSIIKNSIVRNGRLINYIPESTTDNRNYAIYEGTHLFYFKGNPVTFHYIPPETLEGSTVQEASRTLNTSLVIAVIQAIETHITLVYGNTPSSFGSIEGRNYTL